MTREELIRELSDKFEMTGLSDTVTDINGIVNYFLSRQKELLEKIGRPLMNYKRTFDKTDWDTFEVHRTIDKALAIIEKEKWNV